MYKCVTQADSSVHLFEAQTRTCVTVGLDTKGKLTNHEMGLQDEVCGRKKRVIEGAVYMGSEKNLAGEQEEYQVSGQAREMKS